MFYIGQKVVCVDELFPESNWAEWLREQFYPYENPVDGAVYTISNVYKNSGDLFLELVELPSPATRHWLAGFLACGFRPVIDTDISFAHEILRKLDKHRERSKEHI